eukprot:gene4021-4269_t
MVLRSSNGTATVPQQAVSANPELVGKSPLQVMDAVINSIAQQGMLVILDNHSSDAIWCCNLGDGNGLWYNTRWSEADWLRSWAIMARQYANSSAVVGAGLRNEPRPTFMGLSFVLPGWGNGNPATDLALAYEKAAAVVLAARPTYLIFVQGLLGGRDLSAVKQRPLVIREQWPSGRVVQDQLVFEVHEYPFLWGGFNFTDYSAYSNTLDKNWGYISASGLAPVWVGMYNYRKLGND